MIKINVKWVAVPSDVAEWCSEPSQLQPPPIAALPHGRKCFLPHHQMIIMMTNNIFKAGFGWKESDSWERQVVACISRMYFKNHIKKKGGSVLHRKTRCFTLQTQYFWALKSSEWSDFINTGSVLKEKRGKGSQEGQVTRTSGFTYPDFSFSLHRSPLLALLVCALCAQLCDRWSFSNRSLLRSAHKLNSSGVRLPPEGSRYSIWTRKKEKKMLLQVPELNHLPGK